MKIKLAVLEKDKMYLKGIGNAFGVKYSNKIELYSFTEPSVALKTIKDTEIDILAASSAFEIDVSQIPERCGFVYLVDSQGIETYNGQRAICKFQKSDLIYKQILSIYAEIPGKKIKIDNKTCRLIAFSSPCGGTGTSTMAAALAMKFAAQGRKTLYLNLENYGSSDVFFSSDGQLNMSDVIFALKSGKANLSLKLESCVKQDPSGVFFYSQTKIALDMLELKSEEILRLISELKFGSTYDYIILDIDYVNNKNQMKIYDQADMIIFVGDGSQSSNTKISRAYEALIKQDQNHVYDLAKRIVLLYNKFSSKTSMAIGNTDLVSIGGAPRYEHASEKQILDRLFQSNVFDKIIC